MALWAFLLQLEEALNIDAAAIRGVDLPFHFFCDSGHVFAGVVHDSRECIDREMLL